MRRKDFNWNTVFNFTMNRNKLVELYGDGEDDIPNNLFLGKSLGATYGYKWIGVVQETDTDYIAAKIAEGKATKSEYADKIAERQQWRDDINAAKDEIERLEALEPDPEEKPEMES
jgi:hypothetical protein